MAGISAREMDLGHGNTMTTEKDTSHIQKTNTSQYPIQASEHLTSSTTTVKLILTILSHLHLLFNKYRQAYSSLHLA